MTKENVYTPKVVWQIKTQQSDDIYVAETFVLEKVTDSDDKDVGIRCLNIKEEYDVTKSQLVSTSLGCLGNINGDSIHETKRLNDIIDNVDSRLSQLNVLALNLGHRIIDSISKNPVRDIAHVERDFVPNYTQYSNDMKEKVSRDGSLLGNAETIDASSDNNHKKSHDVLEKDILKTSIKSKKEVQTENLSASELLDEVVNVIAKVKTEDAEIADSMKKKILEAIDEKMKVLKEVTDGLNKLVDDDKNLRKRYGVKNVRVMAKKLGYDYDKLIDVSMLKDRRDAGKEQLTSMENDKEKISKI